MKFITLYKGKTFHLVDFVTNSINTMTLGYSLCGKHAVRGRHGEKIHDTIPAGRLCKSCKRMYLKKHTEEQLFLELV